MFLNEAGSAGGPPLRSRASRAPQGYQIASRQPWEIWGKAVGPAAGLTNPEKPAVPIRPLPSPCELSQYPRASRRAARVRSGLGSALGIPRKTSRYVIGCSPQEPRPKHDEVKQQRSGLLCLFLKTPPGGLGGFRSEIRSLNQPRLAPAQPCRLRVLAVTLIPMTANYR